MFFVLYDKSLTASQSFLTREAMISFPAEAAAGGTGEDGDPVVPTWDTATRVELLQKLIPRCLHVGQSGTHMVRGCADAHKFIDWHDLGRTRITESLSQGERDRN